MLSDDLPLVVEFIPGTTVFREAGTERGLPVLKNGLPGTSIVFSDGKTVPLPSDQIVEAIDHEGAALVAFGGMKFSEFKDGRLHFLRFKEILPEQQLSPERGFHMILFPEHVRCVSAYGSVVWLSETGLH